MKDVWLVGFRNRWGDVVHETSEYLVKRDAEIRRIFLHNNLNITKVFIRRRYR